jgi:hypothetical protein
MLLNVTICPAFIHMLVFLLTFQGLFSDALKRVLKIALF